MNYTELRIEFKKIIDENLGSDDFLNKELFRPLRVKMRGQGLKFYQYRRPSDWAFDQLRNNELSCTNPKKFNDVFEGVVKSKDDDKIEVKKVIEKASNAVSIACFSETKANQLMYAHYAASYTGFCIEYDYDRMLNVVPDIGYFYPVIYEHTPSSLAKMSDISQAIDRCNMSLSKTNSLSEKIDDLISYFIHKPYVWSYEREWRLIVPILQFDNFFTKASNDGMFHTIEKFDCVSAIYLATNIDDEHRNKIIDIVKEKNSTRKNPSEYIKVYQTHIIESTYKIGRKEIKLSS